MNKSHLLQFKKTGRCKNCDLSGIDLSGIRFRSVTCLNSNLTEADLSNSVMGHGYFDNSNLKKANLSGADFHYERMYAYGRGFWTSFYRANLTETNLSDTKLFGANFLCANLQGANLQGAELNNANFQGANLRNANLSNSNLQGANFKNAYLKGVNLKNANLQGVNLNNADLTSRFIGIYIIQKWLVITKKTKNRIHGIIYRWKWKVNSLAEYCPQAFKRYKQKFIELYEKLVKWLSEPRGGDAQCSYACGFYDYILEFSYGEYYDDEVRILKDYSENFDSNRFNEAYEYCEFHDNGEAARLQMYEQAIKWFKKAAKNGHAQSQYYLGLMYSGYYYVDNSLYEHDLTFDRREHTAIKWHTKAAKQGHISAQCRLGEIYENRYCVKITSEESISETPCTHTPALDYIQAIKWYTRAAEQGHPDAKEWLKHLKNIQKQGYNKIFLPSQQRGEDSYLEDCANGRFNSIEDDGGWDAER